MPIIQQAPNTPILTNDPRGRWIHGGGSQLGSKGSQAPKQPLCSTYGCTRMHNDDIEKLGKLRKDHKEKHPDDKVPYDRKNYPKDKEPKEYSNCLTKYNSKECVDKRKNKK